MTDMLLPLVILLLFNRQTILDCAESSCKANHELEGIRKQADVA
jgi:hypothetical protein